MAICLCKMQKYTKYDPFLIWTLRVKSLCFCLVLWSFWPRMMKKAKAFPQSRWEILEGWPFLFFLLLIHCSKLDHFLAAYLSPRGRIYARFVLFPSVFLSFMLNPHLFDFWRSSEKAVIYPALMLFHSKEGWHNKSSFGAILLAHYYNVFEVPLVSTKNNNNKIRRIHSLLHLFIRLLTA